LGEVSDQANGDKNDSRYFRPISMNHGMIAVMDSDPDAGRCKDQEESAKASPQV
jgi:hypothetical protein